MCRAFLYWHTNMRRAIADICTRQGTLAASSPCHNASSNQCRTTEVLRPHSRVAIALIPCVGLVPSLDVRGLPDTAQSAIAVPLVVYVARLTHERDICHELGAHVLLLPH